MSSLSRLHGERRLFLGISRRQLRRATTQQRHHDSETDAFETQTDQPVSKGTSKPQLSRHHLQQLDRSNRYRDKPS
jgi:hypothetical protein